MTISLPSWWMVVRMLVASDEATIRAISSRREIHVDDMRTKTLGHGKRGPNLAVEKGNEPLLLLLRRRIACKNLYAKGNTLACRLLLRRMAGKSIVPMFPVSGAEQFTASDAIAPPRPRSSAMTPY